MIFEVQRLNIKTITRHYRAPEVILGQNFDYYKPMKIILIGISYIGTWSQGLDGTIRVICGVLVAYLLKFVS